MIELGQSRRVQSCLRAVAAAVLAAAITSSGSCAYAQVPAPEANAGDETSANQSAPEPAPAPEAAPPVPSVGPEPLDPAAPTAFTRFRQLTRLEANLESSVTRYRHPGSKQVVALVAAIHIGDPSYYHELQAELDRYDLVLFERIGKVGEEPEDRREIFTLFAELQHEISKLLEFAHQADGIDYTRGNLRHSDMSLREFEQALEESAGPQIIPLLDDRAARWIAPIFRFGMAMTKEMSKSDPHFANRMRWQLGSLLGKLDRVALELQIGDIANPDDVIIGLRNAYAWEIFQRSLSEGFQRTAVFYGAAHMPDFERRLLESGWVRVEQTWIPAWHIPVPAAPEAPEESAQPALPPEEKQEDL